MGLENYLSFKETLNILLNKYPLKRPEIKEYVSDYNKKTTINLEKNQGTEKDIKSRLFESRQDIYINILLEHNYEN
jgi:hypothetical protein